MSEYLIEPEQDKPLYMKEDTYQFSSFGGFIDFQGLKKKIKDYAWVEVTISKEDYLVIQYHFVKETTPQAMRLSIDKNRNPFLWMPTQLSRFNFNKRIGGDWLDGQTFQTKLSLDVLRN